MKYLFADEAGCFEFSKQRGASKYFIVCTVHMEDCSLGTELMHLRRDLAWRGLHAEAEQFHATEDPEDVRGEVYELLAAAKFRVDATLIEKSKLVPRQRENQTQFYKFAWYYHFKHCGPRIASQGDQLMIHAASVGTKKQRAAFRGAINEVAQQIARGVEWRTTFWPSSSDPCLQVADYCAWAIQRAYERNDDRRLKQIEHLVRSSYDLFARGKEHYY